jgi:hypothetical protein
MELRRTPDAAFADLAGYPFTPHYLEVADPDGGNPVRLHHLGEGDLAGPVVLLLHGEPTWSYLYRNVLPPLVADGCRVIAPDLIGFGRSDKPTRMQDHTYARHVDWLAQALFDQLDLREVVLFCQDRRRRLPDCPASGGHRRLRRALPRRRVPGRPAGAAELGPDHAGRPRRRGQPPCLAGPTGLHRAVPDGVLRSGPDHRRRSATDAAADPRR